MEVKSIEKFVHAVQNSTPQEAWNSIVEYGNSRAEAAIKESWKKARKFYAKVSGYRYKKLRSITLDWNQENDFVNLIEFTDFFSAVEDFIVKIAKDSKPETNDALILVVDEMYERIGDIKIDRRNLFAKRADEERKAKEIERKGMKKTS